MNGRQGSSGLEGFRFGASGLILLLCASCATVTEEDPPSTSGLSARAAGAAGASAGGGGSPSGGSANGGTGNAGLGGSNGGIGGSVAPSGLGRGGTDTRPPVGASGAAGGGAAGSGVGGSGAGAGGAPPIVDTTPQFPSGTLLLEDDFEAFQQTDWVGSNGSQWAITTDPGAEGNVYGQTETNASTPHVVTAGDTSWTGAIVEADVNVVAFNGSSSGYMAGLCVRVQDAENFYMVGLRSGTGQIQLRAFGESDSNLAQSDYADGAEGVWYHLKVEIVGSTLTAYLDDELMFTYTDATIPNGGIGLCTVRASARFDNVRVTAP